MHVDHIPTSLSYISTLYSFCDYALERIYLINKLGAMGVRPYKKNV